MFVRLSHFGSCRIPRISTTEFSYRGGRFIRVRRVIGDELAGLVDLRCRHVVDAAGCLGSCNQTT